MLRQFVGLVRRVALSLGALGLAACSEPTGTSGLGENHEKSQVLVPEIEPNSNPAQATSIVGTNVVLKGNISPIGEADVYSFTASAGDRLYVATQTASSAISTDTVLYVVASDDSVLERDDQNGTFNQNASSIAGVSLPSTGTYYVVVTPFSAAVPVAPYHLHFALRSGTPVREVEPNDDPGEQATPLGTGWMSGETSSGSDVDFYEIDLGAGDTLFLSLDLDPERDDVEWDGNIGVGPLGGVIATVNDAEGETPNSEAYFVTVRTAGRYVVRIASVDGLSFGTYVLSASVHPSSPVCTTYTSDTEVPLRDVALSTSTLNVPDDIVIGDVDVHLEFTHTFVGDMDVHVVAPDGSDVGLFTDVRNNVDDVAVTLDDEAAFPAGLLAVLTDTMVQPERDYRLHWLDGKRARGTWTLAVYDDFAEEDGTLHSWGLTICPTPAPPRCPAGTSSAVLFSTDFESDDAGFTHSGTADEWERGLPTFAPIDTCNSGVNCFKTDLDSSYEPSSSQDLLSPTVSLAGAVAPITLSWAQKYELESVVFDRVSVDVRNEDDSSPTRVFEHLDGTMLDFVGVDELIELHESAGWGVQTADISGYAGNTIEVLFHLDSDQGLQLSGMAIDDVSVTGCVVVCGDGQVGDGEECDDGNTTAGDCCSSDCQYESAGSTCDDGDRCNGRETCTARGVCAMGTPVACNASDDCHSAGQCNPSTGRCTDPEARDGTRCRQGSCQNGVCAPDGSGGTAGSAGGGGEAGAGAGGSATGGSSEGGAAGAEEPGGAAGADDTPSKRKSSSDEDSGCGCAVPGKTNQGGLPLLGVTVVAFAARRRRAAREAMRART